ncbi:MAG: amino acid permease [Isosphaeraceae bacterium]|nr:amino acid permease [Isosphaeraceae bacterium]
MTSSESSAAPAKPRLPRVLGSIHALSFIVGSVIGSGIFIVPATVANEVPYIGGIAIVWIVGGLFSLAGALALAELGAMLPHAGGPYVYLGAAYGRLPAFLFGWTEFLVIRAGSVATLAAGFAFFASELLPAPQGLEPPIWRMLIAVVAMITVAAINIAGTLVGGGVQVVGTIIKVGALIGMMILPFLLGQADTANLAPLWPTEFSPDLGKGILAAMIGVLWSYDGWVNAGSIAEEVHDPGVNIPKSLVRGMAILIAVYLSMTLAYHLAMPIDAVRACAEDGSRKVAAEFCYRLLGEPGLTAIALVVMSSIFIALNANALSGPRAYFAMARDGLFPRSWCAIHPRFRTPANAIIAQTVWSVVLTVVGTAFLVTPPPASVTGKLAEVWSALNRKPLYDVLYTYVIFGGTVFYTLGIMSVFVLRRTRPDWPRPYKTWGNPVTPALYLAASLLLMGSMLAQNPLESVGGLGIILLGLPAYFLFSGGKGSFTPIDIRNEGEFSES